MGLVFNFNAPNTQAGGDDTNRIRIYESTDALAFTLIKTDSIDASATSYTYVDGNTSKYYRIAFVDSDDLESVPSDTVYGGDIYDGEVLTSQTDALLNTYLIPLISEFQKLGVNSEKGQYHLDSSIRYTYPRWNTSTPPIIQKNNTIQTNSTNYALNATYGYIKPVGDFTATDDFLATYYFSYFDNNDLLSFLDRGVANINAKNPGQNLTRDTIDMNRQMPVVVQGAYVDCLKRLLLDNMIWRNNLIWANPQGALSLLQSLLSIAQAEYTAMQVDMTRRQLLTPKTIKTGRYGQDYTVNGNNFWRFSALGN